MTFNIKTDSRKIKKGDTFVAIKTILSDGHKYIEAAIKAGASKIVCSEGDYSVETLKVEDTRAYLYDYLKETYKDIFSNMKIMVVTGTNGKTTMAYLMYQALNLLGRNASYLGTLGFYKNSGKQYKLDNTTPDICEIYESMVDAYNSGSEYFILEASSQGIAQGRLETLKYDYAVFTNLTHDHLDFHKTMENYALAKLRVFEELKEDGKAFINYDDSYCNYYSLAKNTNITYGKNGGDYKIVDFNFSINGTSFSLENENQIYNFNMPLIGEYNIYNITPVIAILRDLGYSFEEISSITPKLNNGKGRMETIKYKNNLIIVDYAHTPDGIEKIAKTVNEVIKGNIYIIFGVRGNRDRTKRADMTRIATDLAKSVILTTNHLNQEDINQIIGDLTNGVTAKNYEVILDRKKAIEKGISYLQNNDALLILGKGHEDYLNLGDHTIHFDDVEEAKKIIEELNVSQ
ncbi:MAG: UDP-N-acetylmuramoyl-L-alanyl-D-glutamate--2,6-diaminopimelate ligase [Bacilli bacterium]|nr:UDP-N-acetylmuramoyl-L-alanyl-D-glutamate--2,6-diaminopimelate ligase [Bacilli bacterium]